MIGFDGNFSCELYDFFVRLFEADSCEVKVDAKNGFDGGVVELLEDFESSDIFFVVFFEIKESDHVHMLAKGVSLSKMFFMFSVIFSFK